MKTRNIQIGFVLLIATGVPLTIGVMTSECDVSYYHWPQCLDYPDGYGCRCGPGFLWNSKMCVAIGLDSRLEFTSLTPPSYATLLNKPFPALYSFTITAWLRLADADNPGTLFSYTDNSGRSVLSVTVGRIVTCRLWSSVQTIDVTLLAPQWHHLAWTVNQKNGRWQLLINGGKYKASGTISDTWRQAIPAGGELLLGQASRLSDNSFNHTKAFLGHVAFVNVWDRAMGRAEIRRQFRDCPLLHCGAAVQWADFRSGTRGSLNMRWPSAVFPKNKCFSDSHASVTCERYCSQQVGVRCSAQVSGNVEWPRSAAGQHVTAHCPGQYNTTRKARRLCTESEDFTALWEVANVTDCASPQLLDINTQVDNGKIRELDTHDAMETLLNFIHSTQIRSPTDLSYILGILTTVLHAQNESLHSTIEHLEIAEDKTEHIVQTSLLSWNDTHAFFKEFVGVIDAMLHNKHVDAWLYAKPIGAEGDHLLLVVDTLLQVMSDSVKVHIKRGDVLQDKAFLFMKTSRLVVEMKTYQYDTVVNKTLEYKHQFGTAIKLHLEQNYSMSRLQQKELVVVCTFIINAPLIAANHDVLRKSKEENINSALVGVHIFHYTVHNKSELITLHTDYYDNFNISNPKCVSLNHKSNTHEWSWAGTSCSMRRNTSRTAHCVCNMSGWFAATSDMYDESWRAAVEYSPIMEAPSYIGCTLSALMCLTSVLLLTYLKTSSNTAHIHKHFGTSLVLAQLVFMIGINRTEHQVVCRGFAVLFHYLLLSNFLWLMNESFNLYIVIIYAAHSYGLQADSGSLWRFYILGWGLPVVIVGVMLGVHRDKYYASDMCWISWDHVWQFVGPIIGILAVSVLVLIFTAKEHKESSYSKNEKTNSMIILCSKALWTQVILLSVCWCFAVLSIKMKGTIIKLIYALFNIIQGLFFVVFFFLLNDEVRALYRERQKRLQYSGSVYSMDGEEECIQLVDTGNDVRGHGSMNSMRSADSAMRNAESVNRSADSACAGDVSSADSDQLSIDAICTTSV